MMNRYCKTFIFITFIFSSYHILGQDVNLKEKENLQYIKTHGYSIEACYSIAEDHLNSAFDQRKAIPYLEYILNNDKAFKPEVYSKLAYAYYYDGSFDLALKMFTEYIEKEKDSKLKKEAKTKLVKFENAQKIASNPLKIMLLNLGPQLNSKFADLNPHVSASENLLVYCSNRGGDFNIYVSKKPKLRAVWEKSKLAGKLVNTINDEFVAGMSENGSELFVHYNQTNGYEDINYSIRDKGVFRELDDPGIKINSTYKEEGACLSKSGDTLFFASDRSGGFGGFDIYYSIKLPEGYWGPSINLGESINSPSDENYPNLSLDGTKLYFASKGHGSIGGYDIFSSTYNKNKQNWNTPVNFGYPINNAYDNMNIAFTENERYAYISTIDRNSQGDYDIYKVIFLDNKPDYLIIKAQIFINEKPEKIPFNTESEELYITVYKSNETYGIYTFDNRNNSFVLALEPGVYILEINSRKFEKIRKKITVDENYYQDNQRNVILNLKRKQSD